MDSGAVTMVLLGLLGLVNGWVVLMVKGSREATTKMQEAQNAALIVATAMGVKVDQQTASLLELRSDMRQTVKDGTALTIAISEVKQVAQNAVDRAEDAYKEANTVNNKIEKLGLQVVGGGKLNEGPRA